MGATTSAPVGLLRPHGEPPYKRKLGVSRSSLKRTMKGLRDNGAFGLAHVKSKPEAKVYTIYYKINESLYPMRSGYLPACVAHPAHGGSS